jgi:hypothetical protein
MLILLNKKKLTALKTASFSGSNVMLFVLFQASQILWMPETFFLLRRFFFGFNVAEQLFHHRFAFDMSFFAGTELLHHLQASGFAIGTLAEFFYNRGTVKFAPIFIFVLLNCLEHGFKVTAGEFDARIFAPFFTCIICVCHFLISLIFYRFVKYLLVNLIIKDNYQTSELTTFALTFSSDHGFDHYPRTRQNKYCRPEES